MLRVLAVTALLLTFADHWTTWLCLRAPVEGWEVMEANPIAEWLFVHVGLVGGLLVDTAVTVGAVLFLLATDTFGDVTKAGFLSVISIATGYAVINNFQAIHQMGLLVTGSAA